ncbi:MAG: hypothetical protein KI786_13080 [Mameliella sp.]|nr:hypothetical protein [Phaeodactylibacter sp.]
MRNLLLSFAVGLLIISCGESHEISNNSEKPVEPQSTPSTTAAVQNTLKPQPLCPVDGKMLGGNFYASKSTSLYITIVADSSTHDPDLGDSHRKLLVFNSGTCELIKAFTLPIDHSSDYPYQIAQINYNKVFPLLAIKGAHQFFLLDLNQQSLGGPYKPEFAHTVQEADAQSGLIQHLELWESYLIGYAQDCGIFVFKPNDSSTPEAILPVATYEFAPNSYNQAFLLQSYQGVQIIIPSYQEGQLLQAHPVFNEPLNLALGKIWNNQRFVLLQEQSEKLPSLAIDLKKRTAIPLEPEIKAQKPDVILERLNSMHKN